MASQFVATEQLKKQYAGLYLMNFMEEESHEFSLVGDSQEKVLAPILKFLYELDYLEISPKNTYVMTSKGAGVLEHFRGRYLEFLDEFDVYCAVDLKAGEFAFSNFHEFSDDESWQEFLNQQRFEDLRIAVAEHKGIDPVEVVFMSFMNEGVFGMTEEGWDYDNLLGSVWDEIIAICNSGTRLVDLAYDDNGQLVTAEEVVSDIVTQGAAVLAEVKT